MKLIDKDALVVEIKNRRDGFYSLSKSCEKGTPARAGFYAQAQTLEGILSFLDTLEVKDSVPQHSYYETIYHVGKEPRWKVGDILAYYMFFSDHEGEYEFGKVVNIKFDKVIEDWLYTFEDGDECAEEELIREETYRKGR